MSAQKSLGTKRLLQKSKGYFKTIIGTKNYSTKTIIANLHYTQFKHKDIIAKIQSDYLKTIICTTTIIKFNCTENISTKIIFKDFPLAETSSIDYIHK